MKKAILSMALLLMFLLVSCGQAANTTPSATTNGNSGTSSAVTDATTAKESTDNQSVKLVFWTWDGEETVSKQIIANYTAEHPNVSFEQAYISNEEYKEKMAAALAANQNVDIFGVEINQFYSQIASRNQLLQIDDLMAAKKIDTSGYQGALDKVTYEGKHYTLPVLCTQWFVIYNKDIFKKMGVPFPKDDWTWDEFRETAKKLTAENGANGMQWGIHGWTRPEDSAAMAFQNGVSIMSDDLSLLKQSLQWKADVIKDGSHMPYGQIEATSAFCRAYNEKQMSAMQIIGDFGIKQLRESTKNGTINFEFDIAALPHLPDKPAYTTFSWMQMYGINAKTKYPEQAFDFLAYQSGEPGAIVYANAGTLPAYRNDKIEQIVLGNGSQYPENIELLFKLKDNGPGVPAAKNIDKIAAAYKEETDLALIGEQTIDQAIANFVERRAELSAN